MARNEETLDFDGAIYLEWHDPRLAYEPADYGVPTDWVAGDYSKAPTRVYQGDFAVKELYEGWRPHVVIPNGIGDWSREGVTMQEGAAEIAYFDESTSEVSEFVVTVEIRRRPMHMIISILLPMVLLVSLTWVVFCMDNETLANRVNITFVGILSVVAYYFVTLNNVPEVSYLTFVDAFIISTFIILTAGVVLTVVMENYTGEDKREAAARVDRICRWAFPLAYFLTSALLGIIFLSLY